MLNGDTYSRRDYVHIYTGDILAAQVKGRFKRHTATGSMVVRIMLCMYPPMLRRKHSGRLRCMMCRLAALSRMSKKSPTVRRSWIY
jgi:hypothetical protein